MSTISNAAGPNAEGFDGPRDEPAAGAERLAERAAASASRTEREIRRAAEDAVDRFRRAEPEIARMLDQNLRKVREYIEKNPVQSAAIAFAAGVVLSSLLRR